MCEDANSLSTQLNIAPGSKKNSPKVAFGKSKEAKAMSTKFQNQVEISHAHVRGLNSVGSANTQKVFVKRFDHITPFSDDAQWARMIEWCRENLYHGGHYEPNWTAQYPSFYFFDEKEYTLFLLRWS